MYAMSNLPRKNSSVFAPAVVAVCLALAGLAGGCAGGNFGGSANEAIAPAPAQAQAPARAQAQDSAPARPLTFDDATYASASKRAADENKFLLVLFSGEWVTDEATLKTGVLQDKRVTSAIANRLVAVRVDAVRDQDLMKQFTVRALPSMILFNSAGTELARWGGVPKASALAGDLSAVLASGQPLAEIHAAGEKNNTGKLFKIAAEYDETSANAEALKKYLQALDAWRALKESNPAKYFSAGPEDILYAIAGLGERYPEAKTALQDMRAKSAARIAERKNDISAANTILYINRGLNDWAAAIRIFEETLDGGAREGLRADAFVAYMGKRDYARAVSAIPPDKVLVLLGGKDTSFLMHNLCKAIPAAMRPDLLPRPAATFAQRASPEGHRPYAPELAVKSALLEAYAGVNDTQTATEIARSIIGKKAKPADIAQAYAALLRARQGDAPEFGQAIGLPPAKIEINSAPTEDTQEN